MFKNDFVDFSHAKKTKRAFTSSNIAHAWIYSICAFQQPHQIAQTYDLHASNINYVNSRLAKLDKHQQEDDINLQNTKHRFHEI